MNLVCGVDGCKGGWVAIEKDLDTGEISWRLFESAHELIHNDFSYQVIAIDIPIGLQECGPRICDIDARKILGQSRASSVFPAPIRPVLAASNYEDACQIRFQAEGKKMSRQAWAIVSKIKEIDSALQEDISIQSKVWEIHPEVSFYYLARERSMRYSKKRRDGKNERRNILDPRFGPDCIQAALDDKKSLASEEDDILDAFVALWTAERIAMGESFTIPDKPPRDSYGLSMQMVAGKECTCNNLVPS